MGEMCGLVKCLEQSLNPKGESVRWSVRCWVLYKAEVEGARTSESGA